MHPAIASLLRLPVLTLPAAALLIAAVPAAAQDAADPPGSLDISGGVTAVTDYRFRGISYSGEDAAIQPTITVSLDNGLYVGAWASNLADTPVFGEAELDIYAGYAADVLPGTTLDVGLVYYIYPDGQNAFGNSDYFEPAASLRTTIGPVTAKVGVAYAWSQSAIGNDDNLYLYTDLSLGMPTTPVTLVAHIGQSDGSLAPGGSYRDWALGADVSLAMVTLGVRYVDTDIARTGVDAVDTQYDATLLFTAGVSF